jgi:hypothetical protein
VKIWPFADPFYPSLIRGKVLIFPDPRSSAFISGRAFADHPITRSLITPVILTDHEVSEVERVEVERVEVERVEVEGPRG